METTCEEPSKFVYGEKMIIASDLVALLALKPVWAAALIMLDAVLPPWIFGFLDMVRDFDAMYTHRCWPLLYQQVYRFVHEHMPNMMRREDGKLSKAIAAGRTTDFDPQKPWNHLFYLACTDDADGAAEQQWWQKHFIAKTTLALVGVVPVNRFIDGDAPVAAGHLDLSLIHI